MFAAEKPGNVSAAVEVAPLSQVLFVAPVVPPIQNVPAASISNTAELPEVMILDSSFKTPLAIHSLLPAVLLITKLLPALITVAFGAAIFKM
jgi:hypothetical protein